MLDCADAPVDPVVESIWLVEALDDSVDAEAVALVSVGSVELLMSAPEVDDELADEAADDVTSALVVDSTPAVDVDGVAVEDDKAEPDDEELASVGADELLRADLDVGKEAVVDD